MYTQSITRRHRTAFLLAIDGSGSMAEEIRFRGLTSTKAEAVAAIANELLFELIERARRSDGVRDYYDIALIGYSGDDEVYPLLPGGREMVSVTELAGIAPTLRRTAVECRLPDGGIALREVTVPTWIEPHAVGQTPMCEALRRIRDLAAAWCADPAHAESFPPVVFHITDGEATDCDDEELRTVAGQIRDLSTADGRVLLITTSTSPPMRKDAASSSPRRRRVPTRTAMPPCSATVRALCPKSSRRRSARRRGPEPCHPSAA